MLYMMSNKSYIRPFATMAGMNETYLHRTGSDRILGGVLGGVAKYFGWDPVLLRVVYVVVTVLSAAFPGILIYLAAWVIMPLDEDVRDV